MTSKQNIIPRIMFAAAGSGSGKTTFTCGFLQALLNLGKTPVSFKCGPDYIDPMFHSEVLGLQSRNLDLFFTNEEVTKYLLYKNSQKGQIAVLEGVMGYYDGLAGISTEASSYHLARVTQTPVILILDCKGKSLSILAEIKGFLEYKKDHNIQGVILNRFPAALYEDFKELIEKELGIRAYGYLPVMDSCMLESRHLGLVTAKEVGNLKGIIKDLAEQIEKTVDLQGLIHLAGKASPLNCSQQLEMKLDSKRIIDKKVRIAVAYDHAFCFYYQDNLELLEELGAEIVKFSPLEDKKLPDEIHGILLGGGYPEINLEQLSNNITMRNDIKKAAEQGMPIWAECGGFMYLHQWIESQEGRKYPMVGIIEGTSYPTGKLNRFGYITLTAKTDNFLCQAGEQMKGHEFHYWDSNHNGEEFLAEKPLRKRKWDCILLEGNMIAGYPHVHFYSNINVAKSFVQKCFERISGNLC